jgi:hypothetical protein
MIEGMLAEPWHSRSYQESRLGCSWNFSSWIEEWRFARKDAIAVSINGRTNNSGTRNASKRESDVADNFPHQLFLGYVRSSSAEYCLALRP